MASNRGAFETSSHRKLAAVSTSSNIPLFPLTAMLRNSLLHQSWNLIRFQWNKHRRMKIYLGYVQSISLQLRLMSRGAGTRSNGCGQGIGLDTVGMNE
jgi:hypothetical protein